MISSYLTSKQLLDEGQILKQLLLLNNTVKIVQFIRNFGIQGKLPIVIHFRIAKRISLMLLHKVQKLKVIGK
jgi:hypothetical protein